jgi:hypothetical protein
MVKVGRYLNNERVVISIDPNELKPEDVLLRSSVEEYAWLYSDELKDIGNLNFWQMKWGEL